MAALRVGRPAGAKPTRLVREGWVLVATLAYLAVHVLARPVAGRTVIVLALVPIAVAGWAWGRWGGFAAGLAATPVHLALAVERGEAPMETFAEAGGVPPVMAPLLGLALGYYWDQARRVAVTEAALREERDALAESEERFRTAFEESSVGLCIVGLDGRVLHANPALGEMMRAPAASFVGRHVFSLGYGEDVERERSLAAEALRGERRAYTLEKRLQRADGEAIWVVVHVAVARDATGAPRSFVAQVQDVTHRRLADRTRAQLAAIVDSSQDAILSKDLGGRILSWNPAAEALYGWTAAEAVGQTISLIVPPERLDEEADILRRLRAGETLRRLETQRMRRDGTRIPVALTISPIRDDTGRLVAISSIGHDISDRRALEREREAQHETMLRVERLRALGALVAGVAHEINNPLTYLQGNIELALLDLEDVAAALGAAGIEGGADLDGTRQGLRSALGGAERIARITKALKVVARQRSAERTTVDLGYVVRDIVALARVGVPDNVALVVEAEEGATISGDASELHQTLLNLVRNSVEAIGEREGRVTVRVRREGEDVVIEVADDGPGIPPEVRARLFTPFLTTKAEGTGLGLSIVHSIVVDHGGRIDVESEPDAGATFRLRFAAVRAR